MALNNVFVVGGSCWKGPCCKASLETPKKKEEEEEEMSLRGRRWQIFS